MRILRYLTWRNIKHYYLEKTKKSLLRDKKITISRKQDFCIPRMTFFIISGKRKKLRNKKYYHLEKTKVRFPEIFFFIITGKRKWLQSKNYYYLENTKARIPRYNFFMSCQPNSFIISFAWHNWPILALLQSSDLESIWGLMLIFCRNDQELIVATKEIQSLARFSLLCI